MESVMFFGWFILVKYIAITVEDYKSSFGEKHNLFITYARPLQDALLWASNCVGRPEKAFHGKDVVGDDVVFSDGKDAYHHLLTLCAVESGAEQFFDLQDPMQRALFIKALGKMIKRNLLDYSFERAFQMVFYESPRDRIYTLMLQRSYEIRRKLALIKTENYDNFVLCRQIEEIEKLFSLPHE